MSSDDKKPASIIDEIYGSITNASASVSKIAESAKEGYNTVFEGYRLYLGLIAVVIVCVLLAYLLYYLITTRVFLQSVVMAEETKTPIICTEKSRYPFIYDKTGNGDRRSYTFWIYIHDMNKYKGIYKNVFNITTTEKNTDINQASPFIFLDKNDNRMYVRFANNDTSAIKYSEITDTTLAEKLKTGITIPYIPLQRWVHIGIVCNANSYKNYIYAYVDGDLVSSTSTGEYDNYITGYISKDLKNLNLNVNGFLNIGGNNNDLTEGTGFSGLVSKITTYNYELNQKDIYNDYYKGPIGGFLSKLGLSNYGVRSPIYKI